MCVSDVYLHLRQRHYPQWPPVFLAGGTTQSRPSAPKHVAADTTSHPIYSAREQQPTADTSSRRSQCARRLGVVMSFVLPTVFTRLRWSNIPYFGYEIRWLERRFKRENKVIGTQQILLLIKRASPFKNINSKNKF